MIRKSQSARGGLTRAAKLLLGACAVLLLGVHCRGEKKVNPETLQPGEALATFAGGCFWCILKTCF